MFRGKQLWPSTCMCRVAVKLVDPSQQTKHNLYQCIWMAGHEDAKYIPVAEWAVWNTPTVLAVVRSYVIVVLIYKCLTISNTEQLFLHLLAIYRSLGKELFKYLVDFLLNYLLFCCWVEGIPHIFWILTPCQIHSFKYCLPFHSFPFHFLMVSLAVQKLLVWCKSTCLFLPFGCHCCWYQIQ